MKLLGSLLFYIKQMFGILKEKTTGKKTTYNEYLVKEEIQNKVAVESISHYICKYRNVIFYLCAC